MEGLNRRHPRYRIGRRTGANILDGKKIGKLADGTDNFNDYWTDSGSDTSTTANTSNLKSTAEEVSDNLDQSSLSSKEQLNFNQTYKSANKSRVLSRSKRKSLHNRSTNTTFNSSTISSSPQSGKYEKKLKGRETKTFQHSLRSGVNNTKSKRQGRITSMRRKEEDEGTESEMSMFNAASQTSLLSKSPSHVKTCSGHGKSAEANVKSHSQSNSRMQTSDGFKSISPGRQSTKTVSPSKSMMNVTNRKNKDSQNDPEDSILLDANSKQRETDEDRREASLSPTNRCLSQVLQAELTENLQTINKTRKTVSVLSKNTKHDNFSEPHLKEKSDALPEINEDANGRPHADHGSSINVSEHSLGRRKMPEVTGSAKKRKYASSSRMQNRDSSDVDFVKNSENTDSRSRHSKKQILDKESRHANTSVLPAPIAEIADYRGNSDHNSPAGTECQDGNSRERSPAHSPRQFINGRNHEQHLSPVAVDNIDAGKDSRRSPNKNPVKKKVGRPPKGSGKDSKRKLNKKSESVPGRQGDYLTALSSKDVSHPATVDEEDDIPIRSNEKQSKSSLNHLSQINMGSLRAAGEDAVMPSSDLSHHSNELASPPQRSANEKTVKKKPGNHKGSKYAKTSGRNVKKRNKTNHEPSRQRGTTSRQREASRSPVADRENDIANCSNAEEPDTSFHPRRSKRECIPPLERWRNQRRIFQYASNGEMVCLGIDKGTKEDDFWKRRLLRKNGYLDKKKKKIDVRTNGKDGMFKLCDSENAIKLVGRFDNLEIQTPAAVHCKDATYSISKALVSSGANGVSFGYLHIHPKGCKEMQFSPNSNIHFIVQNGEVEVIIEKSRYFCVKYDMFIVPSNVQYAIRNVGVGKSLLSYTTMNFPFFKYQQIAENAEHSSM